MEIIKTLTKHGGDDPEKARKAKKNNSDQPKTLYSIVNGILSSKDNPDVK